MGKWVSVPSPPPPPRARQVGQPQPKPPSRHGDQGGGGGGGLGKWAAVPSPPPPPAKPCRAAAMARSVALRYLDGEEFAVLREDDSYLRADVKQHTVTFEPASLVPGKKEVPPPPPRGCRGMGRGEGADRGRGLCSPAQIRVARLPAPLPRAACPSGAWARVIAMRISLSLGAIGAADSRWSACPRPQRGGASWNSE